MTFKRKHIVVGTCCITQIDTDDIVRANEFIYMSSWYKKTMEIFSTAPAEGIAHHYYLLVDYPNKYYYGRYSWYSGPRSYSRLYPSLLDITDIIMGVIHNDF
jgi:hypothetical protein